MDIHLNNSLDVNSSTNNSNSLCKTAAPVLALPVILSACKSDSSDSSDTSSGTYTLSKDYDKSNSQYVITPRNKADAARFLQQASFSSTADEIERLLDSDFQKWLNWQQAMPIQQTSWDWLIEHTYYHEDFKFSYRPACNAIWQQLITSSDVLRKRVALALSEIFVISMKGIGSRHKSFTCAGFWDVLNQHAFGNYRDLLQAVTLNPAMGDYLSTNKNKKADNKTGRAPDENYAREILQLFSIGLYELNIDGSLKLNDQQQPIETYQQNDIINLARVFTGWSFDNWSKQSPRYNNEQRNPMKLNPEYHSEQEKAFLDSVIPAGTDGESSLQQALDIIFNHPNVAPFISRQLIQRLVSNNPSPAYIARVARIFENNNQGVRGDLAAVVKAILLDREARNISESNTQGKLREPMLRFVQWARQFSVTSYSDKFNIGELNSSTWNLGQSPLLAPSVFNFYRPNYIPPNTFFAEQKISAPEFQISDETSVAAYCNFIGRVISKGVGYKDDNGVRDVLANYKNYLRLSDKVAILLQKLNLELAANQITQSTLQLMQTGIESISTQRDNWREERLYIAIKFVLTNPEYIVQK